VLQNDTFWHQIWTKSRVFCRRDFDEFCRSARRDESKTIYFFKTIWTIFISFLKLSRLFKDYSRLFKSFHDFYRQILCKTIIFSKQFERTLGTIFFGPFERIILIFSAIFWYCMITWQLIVKKMSFNWCSDEQFLGLNEIGKIVKKVILRKKNYFFFNNFFFNNNTNIALTLGGTKIFFTEIVTLETVFMP
jgi:hypothetical protein